MNDWDKLIEPAREALEALIAEGDAMADRIEALTEQLAAARKDAEEAEAYAGELEANGLANRVAIMRLEAKLATCEKYRDAYAECDRIGTQAVRDLEARAERLEEALLWCSGSADFTAGGVAREGWLKVCEPLLTGGKDE